MSNGTVELPDDVIRVFPRKASWVPDDDMAFVGTPLLFRPDAKEVHVSCVFSWDIPECERLVKDWRLHYRNVKIGGPALETKPGEFVPGMYLKHGYTITSRGCTHKCPFCMVHKREGALQELPIRDGWIVEDSNLLACSRKHQEAVFAMLERQPEKPRFTGGFENRLVTPWLCEQIAKLKTRVLYLAFDRGEKSKPLTKAAAMLLDAGVSRGAIRCYCLVGYGDDTPEKAEARLRWAFEQGVTPFAMFYRPVTDRRWYVPPEPWAGLVKDWTWDKVIFSRMKRHGIETRKGTK
jgi:hypothetical protein